MTGLGGIITLPVAIPANIASVLFVQVRMIAAIAHLGGYDVKNDKVKTLVYACLVANSAKDILKDVGVAVGNKLALNAVKAISGKTLAEINKRVGFKLFTKFGEKGIINLGKAVPLLGDSSAVRLMLTLPIRSEMWHGTRLPQSNAYMHQLQTRSMAFDCTIA